MRKFRVIVNLHLGSETPEELSYDADMYEIKDGILTLTKFSLIVAVFAPGYWLMFEVDNDK